MFGCEVNNLHPDCVPKETITRKQMNSRLKLRLEAARLAAQLNPASGTELVKQAKAIEKYILGKAQLPEYISIEEAVRMNIEEGMNAILKKEKAEINDIGRRIDDAYDIAMKQFIESGTSPGPEPATGIPLFGTDKQMHPHGDVEPSPILPECTFSQTMLDIARDMPDYRFRPTAPGGMPCADGENIFLQQNGENVE